VIGAAADSEGQMGQGSAYVFAQPVIVHNIYLPVCIKG